MPLSMEMLPPNRSVYDYPATLPGIPLTEEQEEQKTLATIAGTVLAVATAKKALSDALTIELVSLLRATDLLSPVAVTAFGAAAARIVGAGNRRSRELTWSGVRRRAEAVGIDFTEPTPEDFEMPSELRYSRGTSLAKAYERVAEEYKKWLDRDISDPIIEDLVRQYEDGGVSPLPRPDEVSSDAVERRTDDQEEQEWKEVFRRSQAEQREATRRAHAEITRDTEAREARRAEARERAEARQLAREREDRDSEDRLRSSSSGSVETYRQSESGTVTSRLPDNVTLERVTLTPVEVEQVIEKHAQQKAEELAQRMVEMDIQSSSRNAHNLAMQKLPKKKVIAYRRVIHPELSKSGTSCGLCIVASTAIYTRAELMPIHAGCNCETAEIYRTGSTTMDPGASINQEDLRVFYEEAGNTTHGWDLKRQRYKIVNHPEYGPTLVNDNSKKQIESVSLQGARGEKP